MTRLRQLFKSVWIEALLSAAFVALALADWWHDKLSTFWMVAVCFLSTSLFVCEVLLSWLSMAAKELSAVIKRLTT